MLSLTELFFQTFRKKEVKNWDTVYIMVDLHGVIIPSTNHYKNNLIFLDPLAQFVLRYLSDQEDIKLILWTSSPNEEIESVRKWLRTFDIKFDFVNSNPDEANTEYANFEIKPYFNILLDDKAGFDPKSDWNSIKFWIDVREQEKYK